MHMDEEGDQATLVEGKTYYLKENEHKILKHLGLQSQGNDYTFRFLIMQCFHPLQLTGTTSAGGMIKEIIMLTAHLDTAMGKYPHS